MMIINEMISPLIGIEKNNMYFAHYIGNQNQKPFDLRRQNYGNYDKATKKQFVCYSELINVIKFHIYRDEYPFHDKILYNYGPHIELIIKGANPNKIAKIIRNDELDKLQKLSSQNDFAFNQTIEPSLYEIHTFINQKNVTLIDYAAFFSAVKCFKYLLVNGAKVETTGKYAIAGGNLEIIHLCEQSHSSFEDAYETAIEFFQNDVFKYLYENKVVNINNFEELGKICIQSSNYELFSYLEKEGLTITDDIIYESAKIGNIFIVKYFLEESKLPKYILLYSVLSCNNELVEYILKKNDIYIDFNYFYF